MDLEITGDIWFWRGPSPYHFVTVPDEACGPVEAAAAVVSYGWGMVPVTATLGTTTWTTSLFPKDGGYIVPVKDAIRRAEDLDVGDIVTLQLTIEV